ncbi:MAG: hypothetical protein INH41_06320 [Myxococcaceae bacterium]|nr:hypothetical protein [Myxococcaceae bacterium]MCA3012003.1 hypothetical protein [Myxococcaceae bacterium]
MTPRARLEAAQAALLHARAAKPPHSTAAPEVDALAAQAEQLEGGLPELRREAEAHRALHARWDDVRSGRPLHPVAWLAAPAVLCAALSATGGLPCGGGALLRLVALLGSVDAVLWLRTVRRSRRLREDGGGRLDEPVGWVGVTSGPE